MSDPWRSLFYPERVEVTCGPIVRWSVAATVDPIEAAVAEEIGRYEDGDDMAEVARKIIRIVQQKEMG